MNNVYAKHTNSSVFPACFVEFPYPMEGRRAAFFLAAEEYLANSFPLDNYLFTWQLNPTVVMGRNQVAHLEFDLDFCKAQGIDVNRRKSGGGAIYADRGNIMISLVTGAGAVEPLFEEYADQVAVCLCHLGAKVKVAGRNDIVLEGGGKICGNAFYHLSNRNIVHGTMLYDTNYELMLGALTPEKAKLQSKGVTSVKSRISLLKDALGMSVEALREALRRQLTNRSIPFTEQDVKNIEAIEAGYYDPEYLFGHSAHADVVMEKRFPGCGTISLHFSLKGSQIEALQIKGDYFALGDVQTAFNEAFVGKPFTRDTLLESVRQYHPEETIRGLDAKQLEELIAENEN